MSRALLSAAALRPAPCACALCGAPAAARVRRLSRVGLRVAALACPEHEHDIAYALWTATARDVATRVPAPRRLARASRAERRAEVLARAAARAGARGASLRGTGAVAWRLARDVARRQARGLVALARALRAAAR